MTTPLEANSARSRAIGAELAKGYLFLAARHDELEEIDHSWERAEHRLRAQTYRDKASRLSR